MSLSDCRTLGTPVLISAFVPETGSLSAHDLVIDYKRQLRSTGKYACDLNLCTEPALRDTMRMDRVGVFTTAYQNDKYWVGQIIIVAEVSKDGEILHRNEELLMRGRRGEPVNL